MQGENATITLEKKRKVWYLLLLDSAHDDHHYYWNVKGFQKNKNEHRAFNEDVSVFFTHDES